MNRLDERDKHRISTIRVEQKKRRFLCYFLRVIDDDWPFCVGSFK